jgi:hypothetical protein
LSPDAERLPLTLQSASGSGTLNRKPTPHSMINSNACFTYLNKIGGIPIMSKAMDMALLKEASEMFNETGCVPGIDGEEVPAERIVPEAKEYISETIDDPEAIYDPEIWDAPGFTLVLSWLAQKWHRKCSKLAPRGSKNPEQYLSKEEQKACLDSAAAELIREITQGRSLS